MLCRSKSSTELTYYVSMENCKKESAHKVDKRNATKTPLKPRLRISIFQLIPGNRLLRIEQSGVASSTKVPPNLKKRESVKLKGSVKKGKQEPKNHHQSQHSPNSHALFATDKYSGIKMVFLSNERLTITELTRAVRKVLRHLHFILNTL